MRQRIIVEETPFMTITRSEPESKGSPWIYLWGLGFIVAMDVVGMLVSGSRAICSPADLRMGMFRKEVVAICGEPRASTLSRTSQRPALREQMTYTSGDKSLGVFLENDRLESWVAMESP